MRTNAGRIKEGAALAARALSCAPLPAGVATPTDPWSRGVQVMRTFFTGAFAQGISLIAVVIGGAMYALGLLAHYRDPEMLGIVANSRRYRPRYDPGKRARCPSSVEVLG